MKWTPADERSIEDIFSCIARLSPKGNKVVSVDWNLVQVAMIRRGLVGNRLGQLTLWILSEHARLVQAHSGLLQQVGRQSAHLQPRGNLVEKGLRLVQVEQLVVRRPFHGPLRVAFNDGSLAGIWRNGEKKKKREGTEEKTMRRAESYGAAPGRAHPGRRGAPGAGGGSS